METLSIFDVRDYSPTWREHDDRVQRQYTTANRFAALFGEIVFRELLTGSWTQVFTAASGNILPATQRNLIDRPAHVRGLFASLEQFGGLSFKTLAEDIAAGRPAHAEARAVLAELHEQHGVALPRFDGSAEQAQKILRGIDALLANDVAAALSYHTAYNTPLSKLIELSGDAHAALQAAFEAEAIYLPHNGLCCACGTPACATCMCIDLHIWTQYCASINGVGCSSVSTICSGI